MMTTKEYESLVILRAAGTEQELARHVAQLEEQVKKLGGSISNSQSMGRRKLAFRIGRQTEGYYYLLKFRSPGDRIGELDRVFRLNETIIRFMILSEDDGSTTVPRVARPAGARSGDDEQRAGTAGDEAISARG